MSNNKLTMSKVLCFIRLDTISFLIFIPLLARAYDFAVNIVMLINITITTNKTHNIHESIYVFYGQEYVLIYSEWESELDFSFAINLISDFDSVSESDSESESSLGPINLDICIFFTLYLHSFKSTWG